MMYKKYVVSYMIIVWCMVSWFISFSHAEIYKEVDMNNVWVKFCNDGTANDQLKNELSLVVSWQVKNLCLYFFNVGTKAVDFVYWFSEGKNWSYWEKMCEADMTTWNIFSKLIPLTKERIISVSGNSYQIEQEQIKIPLGMSGAIYGCIAYKLQVPEYKSVWWMFDLVVRRTAHINLFVWWKDIIRNAIKLYLLNWWAFTTNKKVKAELDSQDKLGLNFLVGNDWNISQNVSITGTISNILWFYRTFIIDVKTLIPGEKYTFVSNVGILPFYKWFFTVDFTVNNTPVFDFDTTGMSEKIKQSWSINESASIFIFSRMAVIVLIILLLVIYRLFVPRRVKSVK